MYESLDASISLAWSYNVCHDVGVSTGISELDGPRNFEFDNSLQGNDIPPEFHSAIEKGFIEAANSGSLIGAPVEVRTDLVKEADPLDPPARSCILLRLWDLPP